MSACPSNCYQEGELEAVCEVPAVALWSPSLQSFPSNLFSTACPLPACNFEQHLLTQQGFSESPKAEGLRNQLPDQAELLRPAGHTGQGGAWDLLSVLALVAFKSRFVSLLGEGVSET